MSATGRLMPFSGTATTTETRVTLPQAYKRGFPNANPGAGVQTFPTPKPAPLFAKNLRIRNLDATNNLLVRINGGAQLTLKPADQPLVFDPGHIYDLTVQASAATVGWDAAAVVSA